MKTPVHKSCIESTKDCKPSGKHLTSIIRMTKFNTFQHYFTCFIYVKLPCAKREIKMERLN